MNPSNVVFDIGGVLVNWVPHLAWVEALGSETEAQAFIERTGFKARNVRADGGAFFADLAAEIADPADAAHFAQYVALYQKTLPSLIQGSWDILDRLRAQGTPVHAITNWSAETWPEGVKAHPRLGKAFDVLVVSGQEGIIKPDARIFDILCTRAGVMQQECVFIDDSYHNVEGARAAGMDAIHFTDPANLETELKSRGLL